MIIAGPNDDHFSRFEPDNPDKRHLKHLCTASDGGEKLDKTGLWGQGVPQVHCGTPALPLQNYAASSSFEYMPGKLTSISSNVMMVSK